MEIWKFEYKGDREVLRREVKTAGEAVTVRLTPDRDRIGSDGDLSFVTVEVTDPVSLSKPERKLFSGKALAVVKATRKGNIILTASVDGVGEKSVTIRAK